MAEKLFYSMGEVAEMFDVKTSLIRHWDSQFSILKPKRNKKGNRLFSPQDVENLKVIYHLVKERGMTLEGAKKAMKRRAAGGPGDEIKREAELMTRLRHIRALLVEVREDLKTGGEGVVAVDDFAAEAAEFAAPADVRETDAAVAADVRKANAAGAAETAVPVDPAPASGPASTPVSAPANVAGDAAETEQTAEIAEPEDVAGVVEVTAPEDIADIEAPVAEPEPRPRRKAVVKIEPDDAPETPAEKKPRAPRRPRRKAEDGENKELFAFYEQSLF